MDIYKKNLDALKKKDPLLALALMQVKPNENFEVYMDDKDKANFNIIRKKDAVPLFTHKPLEESMQKINEFVPYSYYPYLYFYGLGNGVFYRLLLSNEQIKRIVIIEPEIEILFIVLNLVDFSEEILSDRVILLFSPHCNSVMINSLFLMDKKSKLYAKVYDLFVFNFFYEQYKEEIVRINQDFIKSIEHNVISVGNDTRDAIIGLQQHIFNLPDMLESPTLIELINKLQNRDTAVIVSTGPSLNKQLPLLKEIAPYVTLFCIDASFPILYKNGIKPDVVLSLERVEATAKFYTDTPEQAQEDVVFAITSIVHPKLKNAITKGVKQFSMRPFGYTNMFGFHEYGYLGIGMSAANMAYEMVVHSRFKRCILIGQDLAFGEDGSSHAQDAVYGSNEVKPKEQKVFVEKYGGGGEVETTLVWKLFLQFFETDIAHTPYKIEVINATEGGARIHGAKEMAFKDAINLIEKKEKQKIILSYPDKKKSAKNLKLARKKCEDIIQYGMRKKKMIEELFLKIAGYIEEIEELNKINALNRIDFKKIDSLNKKIDKVKMLFEDIKFVNYFSDAIQSYIFHQELDIAKILVRYTKNEEERKAKQLEWLYIHKYWLFSLAGGMDCVINVIKDTLKEQGEFTKI
ncbi:motility associated factor glycosyltransferase family protein [Helicobacter sp. faydin-H20]|uniref:motility associated factor glycosyltransferase family protein n=1 Tax=Helicobacter anatolicus TaxID=2905874 RepID=UPI001E65B361|nr:motility associated factor glycosyltransferase family protein [Helicobacter anatolicus]MCE3036877.1 motility associated factor glycosyltransferase family protein [Helicobacter anatolicus]